MRQLIIQVPEDEGDRAMTIISRFEGTNVARLHGSDDAGRPCATVLLHVDNGRVGPLLSELEPIPRLRVSMIPVGALALRPPADEVADQVTDITPPSPLEVFVAGLQSIGSWKGFLSFAVAGGVVVWLGLFTDTVFLLIGAMLIAPFAGPAINTAIATARGDLRLLWRSLARYAAALTVTIAVAALLSLVAQQDQPTRLMTSVASISAAAVLLPLTAGAAGALFLSQGEQTSLVSGAASGMLIAASLAPPAGLVGMATVTGDTSLLPSAAFLLSLQLVGINLSGAIVFRLFGLKPEGPRYARGRSGVRTVSLVATAAGLAALLAWQFGSGAPTLQRDTVEQRMRDAVLSELARDGGIRVVDAELRFTRPTREGPPPLLTLLYVQRAAEAVEPDSVLRARVEDGARRAIRSREPALAPLIGVTMLTR